MSAQLNGGALLLRRNRMIGVVAAICFLGLGIVIVILSYTVDSPIVGLMLAAVVLVPGVGALYTMARYRVLADEGVSTRRRLLLRWRDVNRLSVQVIQPIGAGRGPANSRLHLWGRGTDGREIKVNFTIYSRHDAREISVFLGQHLAVDVIDRDQLARMASAWERIE